MSIFDIDKNIETIDENIETIDENIREHKIKQSKYNQYIKIVSFVNDLKYIIAPYKGDMVYVIESDELYMYANEWIRVQAYYEPI